MTTGPRCNSCNKPPRPRYVSQRIARTDSKPPHRDDISTAKSRHTDRPGSRARRARGARIATAAPSQIQVPLPRPLSAGASALLVLPRREGGASQSRRAGPAHGE
eukprot:scaffold5572_cov390-Prasinococcus_capsulatus_cf.AAC.12